MAASTGLILLAGAASPGPVDRDAAPPQARAQSGPPGAFDRAQTAFMSHDFDGAEAAYRLVLADDTVTLHRREAAVTLAAIAWRVRGDTAAAARVLSEAAGTAWGRFAATSERSRMLRAVGDFAGARAAATEAGSAAETAEERDEATTAWAAAALEPLIRARMHAAERTVSAEPAGRPDAALLADAIARLDSLVRRAPGRLDPARLLVLGGALAGDWPAVYTGWRSYYLIGTGDTLRGPLAAPRRVLRALSAGAAQQVAETGGAPRTPPPALTTTTPAPATIMRALAGSRLFDAAALVALAPDSGGAPLAARDRAAAEVVAYAAFLDTVTRTTDEYYRRTALAQGDSTAWLAALDSAGRALWPSLARSGPATAYTRERLAAELDRRFGTVVNLGKTAGYDDLHMGHRVVDDRRTVKQYGRSATVRFVALDGMASNGFQSWAWDGRAAHGGWGSKALIVQVRPRYAESPLDTWRDLSDTARVRRAAERIAADSAADMMRGRTTPVAYFPGVAGRLQRDGRRELLDSLRRAGLAGLELEAAFERTIGDALVESSIFAHEGRHAIDDALGEKLSPAELEYRAKLSEVAFAPRPRLAFGGIMSPNAGDDTPHGQANLWVLEGIERWMRQHAARLPVDPSAPLLPQLPRLSDASLGAAGRSLDPLAGGSRRPASR